MFCMALDVFVGLIVFVIEKVPSPYIVCLFFFFQCLGWVVLCDCRSNKKTVHLKIPKKGHCGLSWVTQMYFFLTYADMC